MKKMSSQMNTILKAMLYSKNKNKVWFASDFQQGKYFVGYEASARMSDLKRKYPELFIEVRVDRFRGLSINWQQEKMIEDLKFKIETEK